MNGCIYRTKYGECNIPSRSTEYGPLCRSDCTDKHPSNADRIRAMSNEELAEFCIWMCPPGYDEIGACEVERERCYNCWLEWLQREAQE